MTVKVLMVEPGKVPTVAELEDDLDSLQKAITPAGYSQGLIELIPLDKGVLIMCNEEGKILNLPGNRRIGNDIIVGTFYVIGEDEEGNLCSLTDRQMLFYNSMFAIPESFTDDEIEAAMFFEVTDDWSV